MSLTALVRSVVPAGMHSEFWSELKANANALGIGVHEADVEEFVEFHTAPDEGIEAVDVVLFSIDDRPSCRGSEYLLDFIDYASDAEIGLPTAGQARLDLLIRFVKGVASSSMVISLEIALTDSGDIEATRIVTAQSFRDIVQRDFLMDAPPNILYKFALQ